MCCKQYAKNFFVLFQAVKASRPVIAITNHEYAYKCLEVFKKFPNEHDIKRVVEQNNIVDTSSLKAMKIEIPVSKW
jgi:hypothetical protein